MPRKTQVTILEILLVIGVAILIIVLSIWFYSHSAKKRVSNTHMSGNPTYTIDIQPIGDHLQMTLPDVGIVLETVPGKIERDDALEMVRSASSNSQQKKDEAVQVNVLTGSLNIFMD